jgi:hypothetical protein
MGKKNICDLCKKEFKNKYDYDRHANRKTPCNVKEIYNCLECNKIFKFKSKLEDHKKTKTHITNYNINIENLNIDNSTNYYGGIIMNAFEKTDLSKLNIKDIENEYYNNINLENMFNAFELEEMVYPSNNYFAHCFSYFIKIFSKLNFNIAYSENHNCRCISFKRINTNLILYQIISIDNIANEYIWENITYNVFIEKFLELMQNIENKFNEVNFKKVLEYVNKYKNKYLVDDDACKIKIETNLLEEYNKFEQSRDVIVKEMDEEERREIEYFRNLKLDAKRMTLAKRAFDNRNLSLVNK